MPRTQAHACALHMQQGSRAWSLGLLCAPPSLASMTPTAVRGQAPLPTPWLPLSVPCPRRRTPAHTSPARTADFAGPLTTRDSRCGGPSFEGRRSLYWHPTQSPTGVARPACTHATQLAHPDALLRGPPCCILDAAVPQPSGTHQHTASAAIACSASARRRCIPRRCAGWPLGLSHRHTQATRMPTHALRGALVPWPQIRCGLKSTTLATPRFPARAAHWHVPCLVQGAGRAFAPGHSPVQLGRTVDPCCARKDPLPHPAKPAAAHSDERQASRPCTPCSPHPAAMPRDPLDSRARAGRAPAPRLARPVHWTCPAGGEGGCKGAFAAWPRLKRDPAPGRTPRTIPTCAPADEALRHVLSNPSRTRNGGGGRTLGTAGRRCSQRVPCPGPSLAPHAAAGFRPAPHLLTCPFSCHGAPMRDQDC